MLKGIVYSKKASKHRTLFSINNAFYLHIKAVLR